MTFYEHQAPPLPPKPKFALSKSNQIFLLVVAISLYAIIIAKAFNSQAGADAVGYAVGRATGSFIAFALLPSLFAWIVWLISRKNMIASSWTFNIVLGLMLLSIGTSLLSSRTEEAEMMRNIQSETDQIKEKVLNAESTEEYASLAEQYSNSVQNSFKEMADKSTGNDKKYFKIMSDFLAESQRTEQKWYKALVALEAPDIMDFSLLNNDKEFERQKKVLINLREETKILQQYINTKLSTLEKRLSNAFGKDSGYCKNTMRTATQKVLSQKPILDKQMANYIDYANNMIQVLELLQKNQGRWSWKNEEMLFDDDEPIEKYNALFDKIIRNEMLIQELAEQFKKVM